MSSETRVVHVNDKIEGAVYIGRAMSRRGLKASKWANPYKVGGGRSRSEAVRLYGYELTKGEKRHLLADLPELRGKALACWCRHDGEDQTIDTHCHGDILAGYLNLHTDGELRAMATGGDDAS